MLEIISKSKHWLILFSADTPERVRHRLVRAWLQDRASCGTGLLRVHFQQSSSHPVWPRISHSGSASLVTSHSRNSSSAFGLATPVVASEHYRSFGYRSVVAACCWFYWFWKSCVRRSSLLVSSHPPRLPNICSLFLDWLVSLFRWCVCRVVRRPM